MRMRSKLVIAVIAVAGLACSQLSFSSSVLRADQDYFRDAQGRVVFLRGVNVSADSKVAPYLPLRTRGRRSEEVDTSLLDPLPQWGFNTIRLLFIWEAYEPEPGKFNEAYLNRLTEIVDAAWERGLYVIVDMHQDAFSRYLSNGCGDGFPAWAVPERLRQHYSADASNCGAMWAMGRPISSGMHKSYREFYSDASGVRSAFLGVLARLARHFSSHPGVVGYDIINEPWGNEITEIGPLYRDAARSIRREDPTAILFVEPMVFWTTFGFRQTALWRPEFENFAYAPHFYDPFAMGMKSWVSWRSAVDRNAFHLMVEKAREWHVPLFVGEFGFPASIGHASRFADYLYDEFDTGFISGAQWGYTPAWTPEHRDGWNQEDLSIVDDHGALRDNFRPRPYVRALFGAPLEQSEKRDSQGELEIYELKWQQWDQTGETEVFVPGKWLTQPEQYQIEWNGAGLNCVAEAALSRLRCQAPGAGEMRIRVSRQKPVSTAGN